ncbi:MAG: sulfatase-like hydrolase/transferase [Duodenibacillus sp.]|nr:sulfatase-like hydrolase/transferase [Duodenibacillus sp.]
MRDSLTEGSGKRSDMALVEPLLALAAGEPAAKARLFALHTVGSHPDVRKKLWDMPSRFAAADPARDDYVAAYASTILKTDRLLGRIYEGMAELSRRSGRPFSILYFSDHGQAHVKSGGKVLLQHGPGTQGNWDVPLVRIDSDKRERRFLKSGKSGMAFAPGLMDWMGIANPVVEPYRLFDGADDPQAGAHVCPGGLKACRKPDPARPIEARLQ